MTHGSEDDDLKLKFAMQWQLTKIAFRRIYSES